MSAPPAEWDPVALADTPLGHELHAFARRLMGPGPAAGAAVAAALAAPVADRVEAIARTAAECRGRDGASVALGPSGRLSFADAVSVELERATAALPGRQREVLALREQLRLSHAQIATVLGLEPAAVAALLARARIDLREQLRGPYVDPDPPCPERDAARPLLARRQDSEPLSAAEDAWVYDHLAGCASCGRAHAQMLEAGQRYRTWVRR